MSRWILVWAVFMVSAPASADMDGWGWGVGAPPMVAITPPAIVLPQININPVPFWAPPPAVYYGPRYGYAPFGYAERHHGGGWHHHRHDRD